MEKDINKEETKEEKKEENKEKIEKKETKKEQKSQKSIVQFFSPNNPNKLNNIITMPWDTKKKCWEKKKSSFKFLMLI